MDVQVSSFNDKKLTVIVPVYNVEKYLHRCLDSLTNQTFKNLNIICVNDGSTDCSGDILDRYAEKDSRISVIHKSNGGVSSARNIALDKLYMQWQKDPSTCSAFVTFVDPDDYVEEFTYELLLDRFKEGVDAVFYGCEKIYENGMDSECDKFIRPSELFLKGKHAVTNNINLTTAGYAACMLLKADIVFKHNLRFPDGLIFEDAFFKTLYMFFCNYVWYEEAYLYKYCIREGSATYITNKGKKNYAIQRIYICNRLLNYLKHNNLLDSKRDVFWKQFYNALEYAINDCHEDELEQVYTDAEKIINEENNPNITLLQRRINELVKSKDLRESTQYIAAKIVKIKHRVSYDKFYLFFIPLVKIIYTDKAKYIELCGIFKIKLK